MSPAPHSDPSEGVALPGSEDSPWYPGRRDNPLTENTDEWDPVKTTDRSHEYYPRTPTRHDIVFIGKQASKL